MLESVSVTWGAVWKTTLKICGMSPPAKDRSFPVFLNFTEFIADSQLDWALQQHALGAVSKIA